MITQHFNEHQYQQWLISMKDKQDMFWLGMSVDEMHLSVLMIHKLVCEYSWNDRYCPLNQLLSFCDTYMEQTKKEIKYTYVYGSRNKGNYFTFVGNQLIRFKLRPSFVALQNKNIVIEKIDNLKREIERDVLSVINR
jgi:hypothetical protein